MLGSVYREVSKGNLWRKGELIMPGVQAEAGMKGQLAWEREEGRSGRGKRRKEEGRGRKSSRVYLSPSPHPEIHLSPTLCWVLFRHWGDCAVGTTVYLPGSSNSRRQVDLGSGQHSDSWSCLLCTPLHFLPCGPSHLFLTIIPSSLTSMP